MSIFSKILSLASGGLLGGITGLADKFITTGDEKNQFKLQAAALIAQRDSEIEESYRTELTMKADVLKAELTQGDNYTKRARPTVVYSGIIILVVNHVILPWVAHFTGDVIPEIEIPQIFWAGWSGIVMTWSIGRDSVRKGKANKLTTLING